MSDFLKKLKGIWDTEEMSELSDEEKFMFDPEIAKEKADTSPKIVNFQNKNMHISCFKPEDYGSKTILIADELISGSIVIIDLCEASEETSRRIIDFLRGIIHAKGGKFMKVATNTYVLAPKNTEISGTELISELANNDIYI